jgi:hypothetical protein
MNLSSTFINKPEEVLIKALLQVFNEGYGVIIKHHGVPMLVYRLDGMIHSVLTLDPEHKEGDIITPPLADLPGVKLH